MTESKNLLQSLDYSVVQQCMHCGMCLPSCPTYVETGRERNSPRGRISLMRAIADGELATTPTFAEEMSYCVGCLACTSACPAGVDYAQLLEAARAQVEESKVNATPTRSFVRAFSMRGLFVHPKALRAAGRLLWLWQRSGLQTLSRRLKLTALLPRRIRDLEPITPKVQTHFSDRLIANVEASRSARRYRVAMLTGCVQDLVFSDVNLATVDVLRENGCDVVTPRAQHCCGSLHAHNGDLPTARHLARQQLDAINPADFDAIISNAAGCGSHLKHYDRLLADEPLYAVKAAEWSKKLRDVSEWLVEIGFRIPGLAGVAPVKLTYHEACHLCHGQKISAQPRQILRAIPGVELRECKEATWCCGSAGIYNITQPSTAGWLQERKLGHLRDTGATVVATGNPGCHLQIQNGLRFSGDQSTRVVHPVVLLAEAYRAEQKAAVLFSGHMTTTGIKEQIQLIPGQSFRLLRWTENLREVEQIISPYRSLAIAGEGNHWHYHQALELTLFTAGEGTRFVGDQIQPFNRGDLVLLGENLPHYWQTRGSSSGLSVQWSFSAGHPFWGFAETNSLAGFFKSAARGIQFRGQTAQALTVLLHQLTATLGLDRLGLLFRLLATAAGSPSRDHVLLSQQSFSLSAESRHQEAMQAAMQLLLGQYRNDIRLQQLLDVTRMSKPTFSRQFKKHSGKSVNEFLQQIRLAAACHELVTTDHSVTDVALGCGFSQISFFNRIFSRAFRCSPSIYRQQQRRTKNSSEGLGAASHVFSS